jgi:hypothetical protein
MKIGDRREKGATCLEPREKWATRLDHLSNGDVTPTMAEQRFSHRSYRPRDLRYCPTDMRNVGLVQPEGRDGVSPARERRVEGQESPPAASAATQYRVMTLTADRRSTAQS